MKHSVFFIKTHIVDVVALRPTFVAFVIQLINERSNTYQLRFDSGQSGNSTIFLLHFGAAIFFSHTLNGIPLNCSFSTRTCSVAGNSNNNEMKKLSLRSISKQHAKKSVCVCMFFFTADENRASLATCGHIWYTKTRKTWHTL